MENKSFLTANDVAEYKCFFLFRLLILGVVDIPCKFHLLSLHFPHLALNPLRH